MGQHAGAELHTVWDDVAGVRVRGRVNDRALAAESGPHAVFVHGLGMATDYLEPTMRLVGREIAVSALDLPGFGGSRRLVRDVIPSERSESRDLQGNPVEGGGLWVVGTGERSSPTTRHSRLATGVPIPRLRASRSARDDRPHPRPLEELANALIEWLRARRIVAPILVGQSHGCQVSVEAMMRSPAVASALVLNAPTMPAEHRGVLAMFWRVAIDAPREPLSLVPHVVRDYLKAGPVRILATLRDALRDRIEDKLPRVRVPVTIVNGARDPVSPPAWGARLAQQVGGAGGAPARIVVVPGAAHALPFSHPAALTSEILAIVHRVDGLHVKR